MVNKKTERISLEGIRLWSTLIPSIEDTLQSDIPSLHKCWIIERLITEDRNKDLKRGKNE